MHQRSAGMVVAIVTAVLAGLVIAVVPRGAPGATAGGSDAPSAGTEAAPARAVAQASEPVARPSSPPILNDGWFIPAPPGMRMRSNERLQRKGQLPLYMDDRLADAIVDAGFRQVRMRTYSNGPWGTVAIKVIDVDRPRRLLRTLDRRGKGLGRPYPDLPRGHLRTNAVQQESTRAHEVISYFSTATFVAQPYVVQVETYAMSRELSRQRIDTFAGEQHDLLVARDDG